MGHPSIADVWLEAACWLLLSVLIYAACACDQRRRILQYMKRFNRRPSRSVRNSISVKVDTPGEPSQPSAPGSAAGGPSTEVSAVTSPQAAARHDARPQSALHPSPFAAGNATMPTLIFEAHRNGFGACWLHVRIQMRPCFQLRHASARCILSRLPLLTRLALSTYPQAICLTLQLIFINAGQLYCHSSEASFRQHRQGC